MGEPHLLGRKRLAALDQTDDMPAELRAVVHEVGLPLVRIFMECGVTKPQHIRALVTACWLNAQGHTNRQPGLPAQIDALLIRQGGAVTSGMLALLLRQMGAGILPLSPSPLMVQASIEETGKHGLMGKEEKHRVRLLAGIRAGLAQHWPEVWNA
jgi:hypothetical protein